MNYSGCSLQQGRAPPPGIYDPHDDVYISFTLSKKYFACPLKKTPRPIEKTITKSYTDQVRRT